MTDINALIASAIPVQPPDDWFENPGLTHATPIKVMPDGRVYGHVASWDMDHIGMPFGVRPPKSRSNYAYFKTGEIMTASGQLLPVGQLTLAGGHAGLEADAAQAVKHYDDTKSAVADVTVGEDRHGIWVAGALRSDASPEQIRALRASAPSGDWRMINGRLEMVAVCQVNVPGFPIPRALAAGGARMALVAAGSLTLLAQVLAEQEFEARLQRLEAIAESREADKLSIVASAARDRVADLRKKSLADAAELARLRVRDPEKYRQITNLRAAGNFKHLDADFLSKKAAEQPRDDNGRFVQTGAFLRWKNPGESDYQFGQVLGRKVGPDGKIDVRNVDTGAVTRQTPGDVEVIKAVLPTDQVDKNDDRGVPYKKKEGHHPTPPAKGPGATTPANDPTAIDASDVVPAANQHIVKLGDKVSSATDGNPLGTVTKDDDQTAIEVTGDDGVVSVHDAGELVVQPGGGEGPPIAAPTTPVAGPAV